MDLQCSICYVEFDLNNHRPKCLSCGHTICNECLQSLDLDRKCPSCGKVLVFDPIDNIFVIQLMEKGTPNREHEQQMQQLECGIAAGEKLVAQLGKVVPIAVEALKQLQESSSIQLIQMKQALEEMRCGEAGAGAAHEVVLKQALQLVDGLRLMAIPKSSLVAVEEDGTVWKAFEDLGPVGHLLLLQLRADGRLEKGDGSAEAGRSLHQDEDDTVSRLVQPDGDAEPLSHKVAFDAKTPLQDGDQRGEAMELDNSDRSDEALQAEDNPYLGPPGMCLLTIENSDLDGERLKVDDILKSTRWLHARSLRNLKGSGSEVLLRVLAPQLEELEIADVAPPSVMEEVAKMKSLKRLIVECDKDVQDYPDLPLQLEEVDIDYPKENQLRCVACMPRLRSLQVWDYFGANMSFLPSPSQHARLVWLSLAFDDTHWPTALSLIRAHAQSLRVLEVYCGAHELHQGGYYFRNLGKDLAAMDLQALEQLVLYRPYEECDQVGGCLVQLRSFRESLRNSVDVYCKVCPRPKW